MNGHKIQGEFGLGARPALKRSSIFTDRFFTIAVFNGKRIITPQFIHYTVLTEPKTLRMPFSFFGMFLVTSSLFIRGAKFAIGDEGVCGEDHCDLFQIRYLGIFL